RDRVAADLEEQGIQLQNVSRSGSNIVISGVSQDSAGAVNDYLDQYNQAWEYQEQFQEAGLTSPLQTTGSDPRELGNQAVRQAREIVARRIDSYGVAEPTITVYGSGEIQNQIIVELPGVEDFNRVRNLLRAVAKLELKLVHPSSGGPFPSEELARQAF